MTELTPLHWTISAGTIVTIVVLIFKASSRFSAMEVKLNIIWDFLIKRALSEALSKGIVTMNSPPVLASTAPHDWFGPIKDALHAWWKETGQKIGDDAKATFAIQAKWGQWIYDNVCLPQKLTSGECLWAALLVAKEPWPKPEMTPTSMHEGTGT